MDKWHLRSFDGWEVAVALVRRKACDALTGDPAITNEVLKADEKGVSSESREG
jgi:hypothetical protein